MTQQYLTVNGEDLGETNNKKQMIKTYSFTTDDDDASSVVRCIRVSDYDKLLSVKSPSIDNVSNEDNRSETSSKIKRRKSRRQTEAEHPVETKRPSTKTLSWYRKIDWSKPLMIVGIIIVICLLWIKRDIWIPRLLTSNIRVRRPTNAENELAAKELTISTPTTTKISSKYSLPFDFTYREDAIENLNENNNQGIDSENNEEAIASPTKSNSAQKLNIRARRNKLSFNKERQTKNKHRPSQNPSVDDDNVDGADTDEEEDNSTLPLSNLPSEQHQSIVSKNFKTNISSNYKVVLSTRNDIIKQLRKTLKARSQDRNFLATVSKTTGFSKRKLYRFMERKNYQRLTLRSFISLIDTFNLMLLVVPKED